MGLNVWHFLGETMRLPIILDTDPGIDDAAAIAAALFAPELDLQLMTTVAGNVSVEKPP
jgi:non-specific riboncleoside hydrolase